MGGADRAKPALLDRNGKAIREVGYLKCS